MKVTAWQREKYILLGTDFGYFVGFQKKVEEKRYFPALENAQCR